jgi:hypothetical protein
MLPTSEAEVLVVHLDHELPVNVSEDPTIHPVMDEPAAGNEGASGEVSKG